MSPTDKNGSPVIPTFGWVSYGQPSQLSSDGSKIAYASRASFGDPEGAPATSAYLATRGGDGWTTKSLAVAQGAATSLSLAGQYPAYSPDLTKGIVLDTNQHSPLHAPGAQPGYTNLFLRDLDSGIFTTLSNVQPPNVAPYGTSANYELQFMGASADFSHILFTAEDKLTPDAIQPPCPNCHQLYEWTAGGLTAVNVLPGGATDDAIAGGVSSTFGGYWGRIENAISADGSRIYWTAGSLEGGGTQPPIYLREGGTQTLVGEGEFWGATPSGDTAVYTTSRFGDAEMLLFDADTGTSTSIAPAGVDGLLGWSTDLTTIYFVADTVLDDGATAGQPNIYVWHDGETTFIATVRPEEASPSNTGYTLANIAPSKNTSYVTNNGRYALFHSVQPLTGFDSSPTDETKCLNQYLSSRQPVPCSEVFRYDLQQNELECISCNRRGEAPIGHSELTPAPSNTYEARIASEDGKYVFFQSADALVARDINGQRDVYMWRAPGVGGCSDSDGCVSLLSSGTNVVAGSLTADRTMPTFIDSSEDGDVYFTEQSALVPQDRDGLVDLYAAKIDGGFASQQTQGDEGCRGDACQGEPGSTPDPIEPGSGTFEGDKGDSNRSLCKTERRRLNKIQRRSDRVSQRLERAKRQLRRVDRRSAHKRVLRKRVRRLKRAEHRTKKRRATAARGLSRCQGAES